MNRPDTRALREQIRREEQSVLRKLLLDQLDTPDEMPTVAADIDPQIKDLLTAVVERWTGQMLDLGTTLAFSVGEVVSRKPDASGTRWQYGTALLAHDLPAQLPAFATIGLDSGLLGSLATRPALLPTTTNQVEVTHTPGTTELQLSVHLDTTLAALRDRLSDDLNGTDRFVTIFLDDLIETNAAAPAVADLHAAFRELCARPWRVMGSDVDLTPFPGFGPLGGSDTQQAAALRLIENAGLPWSHSAVSARIGDLLLGDPEATSIHIGLFAGDSPQSTANVARALAGRVKVNHVLVWNLVRHVAEGATHLQQRTRACEVSIRREPGQQGAHGRPLLLECRSVLTPGRYWSDARWSRHLSDEPGVVIRTDQDRNIVLDWGVRSAPATQDLRIEYLLAEDWSTMEADPGVGALRSVGLEDLPGPGLRLPRGAGSMHRLTATDPFRMLSARHDLGVATSAELVRQIREHLPPSIKRWMAGTTVERPAVELSVQLDCTEADGETLWRPSVIARIRLHRETPESLVLAGIERLLETRLSARCPVGTNLRVAFIREQES